MAHLRLLTIGWVSGAWLLLVALPAGGAAGRVVLNEIMAHSESPTMEGVTNIVDWVELYNPGDESVDVSGMSLSDRLAEPRRWIVPAGVTLLARARLAVAFTDTLPPSVLAHEGFLNAGFGLDASGDSVILFDTLAQGGGMLDSVQFGLQAADWSIGRFPDATGDWVLNTPSCGRPNRGVALGSPRLIRINEWVANPIQGDDFFELFNPQSQPVSLEGLFLTDDFKKPTKFAIAPLSFMGTGDGAFTLFHADKLVANGGNHVNFALDAGGESLGLYDRGASLIDGLRFAAQVPGVSEGRFPDGNSNIVQFAENASPGFPNLLPLRRLVINEVLSHADEPLEDSIELLNLSSESMDLSGWFLSDNLRRPRKFKIPYGTVIEPGKYVTFYKNLLQPVPGVLPGFSFNSAHGDEFHVFSADASGNLTGYRATVTFGPAPNGVPFGRFVRSQGPEFINLTHVTFGTGIVATNSPDLLPLYREGRGAPNADPVVGPLVFTEVMYHPREDDPELEAVHEYIELKNISSRKLLLHDPDATTNHWEIRGAVRYTFPFGVEALPGDRFLIVGFDPVSQPEQEAEFRAFYSVPAEVRVFGPYLGRLKNGAEALELHRPDIPQFWFDPDFGYIPYILVDRLAYSDQAPWPFQADGLGFSLERRDPAAYGNDPVNWHAGVPTPGWENLSAAGPVPSLVGGLEPQLVELGGTVRLVASVLDAISFEWFLNGEPIPGASGATLLLESFGFDQTGTYSVLAANGFGALTLATDVGIRMAPLIRVQPQPQSLSLGDTAVFYVTCQGTPPFAYQWFRGGEPLPDETNGVLRVPVTLAAAGNYSVAVSNRFGGLLSQPASLDPRSEPGLISPPATAAAFYGQSARFEVRASGAAPLAYQWYRNTTPIAGAIQSILELASVTPEDGALYSVVVTNLYGSIRSTAVPLLLSELPMLSITADRGDVSETDTEMVFTLTRTGSLAIPSSVGFGLAGTAVWGIDFEPLPAGLRITAGTTVTNIAVRLINNTRGDGDRTFTLVFTNRYYDHAFTTASNATVVIHDDEPGPSINLVQSSPSYLAVNPGGDATFSAQLPQADPTGPKIRYQWQFNGINLPGQVEYCLKLSGVDYSRAGEYRVQVSDGEFSAISPPARLHVRPRLTGLLPRSGEVEVAFEGTPLRVFGIEMTTNFVDWVSIGMVTNRLGTATIRHPGPILSHAFYRVEELPGGRAFPDPGNTGTR